MCVCFIHIIHLNERTGAPLAPETKVSSTHIIPGISSHHTRIFNLKKRIPTQLKKLQRKFQRLNQLENAVDDLLRQRFASNEVRSNILFAKHVVDPFVKNGFIISKGEQPGTCSPELTNRTNRLYADCCIRHDSSKAAFIQRAWLVFTSSCPR